MTAAERWSVASRIAPFSGPARLSRLQGLASIDRLQSAKGTCDSRYIPK
jgi:hypothetical protein